eukprot:scaffold25171_cov62-Phaeocystis_antarctica.AAC.2
MKRTRVRAAEVLVLVRVGFTAVPQRQRSVPAEPDAHIQAAHGRAKQAAAERPARGLQRRLRASNDAAQAEAHAEVFGGGGGEPLCVPIERPRRRKREERLRQLRAHEQADHREAHQPKRCRRGRDKQAHSLRSCGSAHMEERRSGRRGHARAQIKRPKAPLPRRRCRLRGPEGLVFGSLVAHDRRPERLAFRLLGYCALA